MTYDQMLEKLAEIEGYDDSMQMLEDAVTDSVCPGICVNCCDYTTEVEPDCTKGHCEACGETSVKSCLILAGLI